MRTGKKQGESDILNGIPILMAVLLIGVAIGTFLFKTATDTQLEYLKQLTDEFINSRQSRGFFVNFTSSMLSSGMFILTAFFVGYFALGKPVSFLIPLFKGLGLGISMTDIFARYGSAAFKISLILIIPCALISSFAVVFACREAGRNSSKLFSYICKRNDDEHTNNDEISVGSYTVKFAAFFVLALLGAAADGLISHFFGGLL